MEVDLSDCCNDFMACSSPGKNAKRDEDEREKETHGSTDQSLLATEARL